MSRRAVLSVALLSVACLFVGARCALVREDRFLAVTGLGSECDGLEGWVVAIQSEKKSRRFISRTRGVVANGTLLLSFRELTHNAMDFTKPVRISLELEQGRPPCPYSNQEWDFGSPEKEEMLPAGVERQGIVHYEMPIREWFRHIR